MLLWNALPALRVSDPTDWLCQFTWETEMKLIHFISFQRWKIFKQAKTEFPHWELLFADYRESTSFSPLFFGKGKKEREWHLFCCEAPCKDRAVVASGI